MLKDAFADIGFFPVQTGIFTAHDALQFGKFRYHAGHQIAFAQARRPFQVIQRHAALQPEVQHFNQLDQALAFIVHVAQAFLEYNGFDLFFIIRQLLLPVFIKKEFRIAEAGA